MRLKWKVKWAVYDLKMKVQRFNRGWADADSYEIDEWFIRTMKPMLKNLHDNLTGYPYGSSEDEWRRILNEMHDLLGKMDKDGCWDACGGDYALAKEEMEKNKKKFFELFAKHFYDLWD